MTHSRARLEELKTELQTHRSNEANFNQINQLLEHEITLTENNPLNGSEEYRIQLQDIKNKMVEPYTSAKEASGNAWPEFEKFVSQFERAVDMELKKG